MTPAQIIAAEVAARYGVAVCPSVVRVCPPRMFTTSTTVWDGKTNTLVYPDADQRKVQHKKAIWAGAVKAKALAVAPAILDRRATVLRLHSDGMNNPAIAVQTGVTAQTIAKDVKAFGLIPHACLRPKTGEDIKLATLTRMRGEGATVDQIAAVLRLKADTVKRMASKAGLPFARTVWRDPKTGQNHAAVLRLKAEGKTPAEISSIIGINPESVRRVAKRAGDPFPRVTAPQMIAAAKIKRVEGQRAQRAARHAVIAQHLAKGCAPRDLAILTGMHGDTIRADLKAMGLVLRRKAQTPPKVARVKAPRVAKPKYQRIDGPGKKQKAKAARQAKVADLHSRGFGFLAICAETKAGKSTIHRDLTELGMITDSRWKKPLLRDLERRAA